MGASTSEVARFETVTLSSPTNLKRLMDLTLAGGSTGPTGTES